MQRWERVRASVADAIREDNERHAAFHRRVLEHGLRHLKVEHIPAFVDLLASELRKTGLQVDDEDVDEFLHGYFKCIAEADPSLARPDAEPGSGFDWSR